jgi:class 3 adenylate cyclase
MTQVVTGGPRILAPTVPALRPLPRWLGWVLCGGLAAQLPAAWPGGGLLEALGVAGVLAVLGCTVVFASRLEDRVYLALSRRPPWQRLGLGMTMPLFGVAGLLLHLLLQSAAGRLGFSNEVLAAPLVGGLWVALASLGTLVLLAVDLVVSAVVRRFRARIVVAVLLLLLIGLAVVVAVSMLLANLFAQAWGGADLGRLQVDLGELGAWSGRGADAVRDHPQLFAAGFHLVGVLLLLPAILSVSMKLADSVTERLEPMKRAFDLVAAGQRDVRLEEGGSEDFVELSSRFNAMVERLEFGERLERTFGLYAGGPLLARIRQQHGEAALAPDLREASVLFADVRGFTSFSERLPPQAVLALLNRWFSRAVEVVDAHEGYLNKFIGDAVMVVFNGPLEQPDHAGRAVRCAIALAQAIEELNARSAFPEVGGLEVGFGVATGPMVMGNVGGATQMEYTVLGDSVNLASRLTGRAPAGQVWISEATAGAVEEGVALAPLPPIEVKGKARPVVAYRAWPVAGAERVGARVGT